MIRQKRTLAKRENGIWSRNMTTHFKNEIQDECIRNLTNWMQMQYHDILLKSFFKDQKETMAQVQEEHNIKIDFSDNSN